ncbi:NAD(P)-dependent alcohol dehydrogenase [Sphingomonas prati]|uniref:Putative zinc-type alcohol dehydrogenase-like protein n=1 Tax=Sphingomonas prati TaxID=1843237 RepID=A0A7W9F2M1_9SPHN|nr:NAD(P)-dependent alcohol dehydrogenase [Sphingomonas prati]MBB5730456.1 putative zinc-type alcohol dehydrogenase-like protein [Sphingomonas prati]GGE94200.1 zinc-binding dehydrogenase [Sphingomonas prati]
MTKALGYAAAHSFTRLKPMEIERDDPKANEVAIEVLFTGVCHSDVHQCENDWGNTVYPCMPGHEVVGRVTALGDAVTRHKVGDLVGVGCMIDSCGTCASCVAGIEQYCEGPNGWLATYNGPMKPKAQAADGTNMYGRDNTFGGYSNAIVVREDFVLKVPAALPIEAAAPILCAGVTTYSPLKHWGVKAGHHVGVVGFGGLGDMGVKLALAMGARVTVFTTTKEKVADAEKLGAKGVVEGDKAAYAALANSFDFILSTVPEKHEVDSFVPLLKRDATFCAVGALVPMAGYNNMVMVMHRNQLAGSLIGSIAETQEVLDFCAEHGIAPDVQVIPIQEINEAFKKVKTGDVRYRYVIDIDSLRHEMTEAA